MNAYLLAAIGGAVGAGAGYFIGKFFESKTLGACPILCNPKISTIFFAVLGIMLATGGK
jgi:fluoride ion exporter CrcB/FEX